MIKLIKGKFEEVLKSEIGQIDLIIADPPDNIGMQYSEYDDNRSQIDYKIDLKKWLSKMKELTSGPIFFTFNQKWTLEVEKIIEYINIPIIQRIQWYFTFGQDQTRTGKYSLCYRPIYWLGSDYVNIERIKIPSLRQIKYKDKRASEGGKMPPNVWEFSRICGNFKQKRKYCPTQLPESLVERIIKGHCLPGGKVLDPFLGSGTTAIVCKKLKIDCTGIDVSKKSIEGTSKYLGIK